MIQTSSRFPGAAWPGEIEDFAPPPYTHTHAAAGPVGVGGFSAAVITALAARPPPPPPPQSYDLSFDSWRDKFP